MSAQVEDVCELNEQRAEAWVSNRNLSLPRLLMPRVGNLGAKLDMSGPASGAI